MDGEKLTIDGYVITNNVIRESSLTVTYLAFDPLGKKCLATMMETYKCLPRTLLSSAIREQKGARRSYQNAVDKYFQQEFLWTEANRRVKNLKHKNVIEILKVEYLPLRKQHVILTEYIDGQPMDKAAVLIPLKARINCFCQGLEGVGFIHSSGFIHGNLKPRNLLFNHAEGRETLVIADWGYAIPKEDPRKHVKRCTGSYMAPEFLCEEMKIDERADLYGLTCNFYQWLTGEKPFPLREYASDKEGLGKAIEEEKPPPAPSRLNHGVCPALDDMILEMLQKDPSRRPFPTASGYLDQLTSLPPV